MNNFNPCSDDLTQMVQFAVQNNILKKESLLYKFMQDTVTQLILMHNPSKKEGNNAQPKGMRWDALTIKFAVALAVKCKIKGFEVVRKWLPWPSWRIVQGYRQADRDVPEASYCLSVFKKQLHESTIKLLCESTIQSGVFKFI